MVTVNFDPNAVEALAQVTEAMELQYGLQLDRGQGNRLPALFMPLPWLPLNVGYVGPPGPTGASIAGHEIHNMPLDYAWVWPAYVRAWEAKLHQFVLVCERGVGERGKFKRQTSYGLLYETPPSSRCRALIAGPRQARLRCRSSGCETKLPLYKAYPVESSADLVFPVKS